MVSDIKDLLLAAKDLIAVTVPFASIWITQKFLAKREEDRYSKDFKQRRIDEFYGPMLSMTLELMGRREAYDEILKGLSEKTSSNKDSVELDKNEEDFVKLANSKLESSDKELIQSMQSLYREKLWMAEPSTVELFRNFIALTEISSIDSKEYTSWKALSKYAKKKHLFEAMEKDLRLNKEKFLDELALTG